MSNRFIKQSDSETAYLYGLGNLNGMDLEYAEDLGIPVSAESLAKHIASGKESRKVREQQENSVTLAAAYLCGDCLEAVPCGHVGVNASGKRYVIR